MVDYITLEELLRDKEVYEFLKRRYEDRLPGMPGSEVIEGSDDPVDIGVPQLGSTEDLSNQRLSPTCEPVPKTPSPTYSFPSISEDEAGSTAEGDPDNLPSVEDKQEEQRDQIVTEPAKLEDNDTVENTVKANDCEPTSSIAPVDNTLLAEDKGDPSSASSSKNTTPATEPAIESPTHKHRIKKPIPRGGAFKPPPVFIKQERKWFDLAVDCKERNIKFKYYRRTCHGYKVVVDTLDDFHEFVKLLIESKIRYHTESDNKTFMAALRYVPKEITDIEIRRALLEESIPVLEVIRKPCQLKHLRATHDMIVVKVVWGYAGRQIFRYNPLRDLYESRRELFNRQEVSPFEKYPFITNAGLSHYKPAELFGIVTGGIMETIKPFRDLPHLSPFVLRTIDDKIASNLAQDNSHTDTTKNDLSSNVNESVSVQLETNSTLNEFTSAETESASGENAVLVVSNVQCQDPQQSDPLTEEYINKAAAQMEEESLEQICRSNEENDDKPAIQMKEDQKERSCVEDTNQNEEELTQKGCSNGEDSNKDVQTQTNKEELEQKQRSNEEDVDKQDIHMNEEKSEQKGSSNGENSNKDVQTQTNKDDLDHKEHSNEEDVNKQDIQMNEEELEHKGSSNGENSNKVVQAQANKEDFEQKELSNEEDVNKQDLQVHEEESAQKDGANEKEIALMNELIRLNEGNPRVLVYVGMKFPHLIEQFKSFCIKEDDE